MSRLLRLRWARNGAFWATILAGCATQQDNETGPRLNTIEASGGLQFVSGFDSDVRLDFKPLGIGTEVDFEDDLGLDAETNVARFDLTWRINRKHGIRASYFDIRRDTGATTDMDIQWGDVAIPAGSGVSAFLDTAITKLAYRYTFAFDDSWEAGLSAGFYGMRIETGMRLNTLQATREYNGNLPLPVLGLFGTWEFHPKWRISASSEALYASLSETEESEEFEGYVVDTLLTVEFDLFDHLGLGIGGNWFVLDVGAEDDLFRLNLDYSFVGGLIYGRVYF